MKLRVKFFIIIFIVLAAGFGTSLFLNERTISSRTKALTQDNMKILVSQHVENFNRYTDDQIETARTLAETAAIVFNQRKRLGPALETTAFGLLEKQIKYRSLAGGGLFFDRDALDGYDFFAPYVYRDGEAMVRDESYMDYNYVIEEWYTAALPLNHDRSQPIDEDYIVTDPYLYLYQGQTIDDIKPEERLGTIYITVDVPITADGIIRGVATADLILDFLKEQLAGISVTENSQLFFLDPATGRHLFHSREDFIFRPYTAARDSGDGLEEAYLSWADQLETEFETGAVQVIEGVEIENRRQTIYYGQTDYGYLFGFTVPDSEAYAELNRTLVQFRLVTILVSLLVIGIMLYMISGITKPIVSIISNAKVIAGGDLTSRIGLKHTRRKDEIGDLAKALNGMIDELSGIVTRVQEASNQITGGAVELNSSAQDLSSGASEQASVAQEVASSVEEMAANISQTADNAKTTEEIALSSSTNTVKSRDTVMNAIDVMNNIAERILIIEEIAKQTDLLALNAAIEAARAGEHGRGFAVVSDEVRKLAIRSKKAAMEIKELSQQTVEVSTETGTMLEALVPDIQKTAELVQNISAASSEQDAGVSQINNAMLQLDQVIQQNASASEEIASTAEVLTDMARNMQDLMNFFRLKEDDQAE